MAYVSAAKRQARESQIEQALDSIRQRLNRRDIETRRGNRIGVRAQDECIKRLINSLLTWGLSKDEIEAATGAEVGLPDYPGW